MSGLNHPLYDSVFTNTAAASEYLDFHDARTVDTRSRATSQSSSCDSRSMCDNVGAQQIPSHVQSHGSAIYDNFTSESYRAQTELSNVIYDNSTTGSNRAQVESSDVIYDNSTSGSYRTRAESSDVIYDNSTPGSNRDQAESSDVIYDNSTSGSTRAQIESNYVIYDNSFATVDQDQTSRDNCYQTS